MAEYTLDRMFPPDRAPAMSARHAGPGLWKPGPSTNPSMGCGMVNASDLAGFRGRLQSRVVRRGDPHEPRNRPLDTQSLINGTAHEPLHLHPDARRDGRRLAFRGSGLWGHGLEERGYVAQVYVSLVRFFQPQKRLISEEHVGLFPGEPTGSSGLEAFSDQAAGSSSILFDRPTHEGNALRVLRSFWLYEPDRCDSFHWRKHSDAVAHAKTDKAPCLSRLAAKQPVRHLRRLQQATYNPLNLRLILDKSGDHSCGVAAHHRAKLAAEAVAGFRQELADNRAVSRGAVQACDRALQ